MTTDNIFSGVKVVDLASFIAGPGAAVILSDFGADVIKVEPPTGDLWRIGYKVPPQPRAKDNYPWHLNNRNKRGLALDLKSPQAGEILERLVKWADVLIVNTPHPARKKLKLEYEDVVQWNPRLIYADVTGYGDKGPDAALPGFDITSYWARSGLLSMTRDAGAPPLDEKLRQAYFWIVNTAIISNGRSEGNVWVPAPPPAQGASGPPPRPTLRSLKWTDQDFASAPAGALPMGEATEQWAYGDLDAGFKDAAVVVDETFVVQSTGHQPMEPRAFGTR